MVRIGSQQFPYYAPNCDSAKAIYHMLDGWLVLCYAMIWYAIYSDMLCCALFYVMCYVMLCYAAGLHRQQELVVFSFDHARLKRTV